jgi:glutamate racemase
MLDQKQSQSIGIFDSGVGGLTVVKQIIKSLPNEHIVYFGDTARVPYGGNSPDTIVRYSLENTCFLMEHNIKLLVVACNTSASCAIDHLRRFTNIPILEVIEPSIERAVQVTRNMRIGVIATKATISSGVHKRELLNILPEAKV